MTFLKFGLLFALVFPLWAEASDAPAAISLKQEAAFLSYLKGGGSNVELLSGLPGFEEGALDPVWAITGRPCILPDRNESLHSIAYMLVQGASHRRMLFQFTLTPAVQKGEAAASLAQLVRNRSITQYWVWMAPEDPQGIGTVIDFKSRPGRGICV